ncbi:MAG: hypothetical protein AB7O28_11460 [Vicinamibacterales bacterium]
MSMVLRARTVVPALLFALTSHAVVHPAFRPVAARGTLDGASGRLEVTLDTAEPLYLEYEVVLRADGHARLDVTWNGAPVDVPQPGAAYLTERAIVELPVEATRAGANRLEARLEGGDAPGFEMRARVHNYYGIAPDVPRAAIVGDAAAWRRVQTLPPWQHAAWLSAFALAGAVLASAAAGTLGVPWGGVAVLVGPGAALAYSLATPLHVWLSLPALAVVSVVPWLAALGAAALVRRPRRAAHAALLAAVTFGSVEVALRLFNAIRPSFVFYADGYNRFRGQPGARHFDDVFNGRGFNDVDRAVARPPAVARRVVALGDSFAVGVVPRAGNYLRLVEEALGPPGTVEVINLGVAGTEPKDYLALLVDEGLAYRPDVVLVTFFVGNDFETRAPRLIERSYVLTLGRALWRLGTARAPARQADEAPAAYADDAPSLPRDRFLEISVERAWVYEPGSRRLAAAVSRAADLLGTIRDLARSVGAEVLVAIAPDEVQVDAGLRAEVAAARRMAVDALDVEQPDRLLTAALAARGIPVVDLLPAFQASAGGERLYKPRDTHWNLAGNRLAAAAIAHALGAAAAR